MKINIYLLLSLFTLSVLVTSCKKDYLNESPLIGTSTGVLYTSKSGFEAGLYGLYNLFRMERAGTGVINGNTANYSNNMVITPAMIGVDNAYSPYPAAGQIEYFFNNFGSTLNPSSNDLDNLFNWLYQIVNGSNIVINQANTATFLTAQDKAQIVGEAKLFRALAYRHLSYLWGGVPLNLGETTGVAKNDWKRASLLEVRQQIIKDLLDAEAGMAAVPLVEGRFPKGMATHYLAEMYLAIGDNQNAQTKANALINSGVYSLVTSRYGVNAANPGSAYTDMFMDGNSDKSQGNTEAIFVFKNLYPTTAAGFQYNIMRRWWVTRYGSIAAASGVSPLGYSAANGGRGVFRFGPTKWALLNYDATDVRGGGYSFRYFWKMGSDEAVTVKLPAGASLGDTLWVEKKVTGTGATATIAINYRYQLTNAATLPTGKKLKDTVRYPTTPITFTNEPLSTTNTAAFNWISTRKWDYAPNVSTDIQQSSNCNDNVYLRLADTYLLLAEAQFNLGNTTGAAQTINILRARANAAPINASQVTMDFIMDERSRELFSEEHRRYTLLRVRDPQNPNQPIWFRRTQQYNAIVGPLIQLRDTLLPIPQSVINANLGGVLSQNAGY
jgi:hypothetical protein